MYTTGTLDTSWTVVLIYRYVQRNVRYPVDNFVIYNKYGTKSNCTGKFTEASKCAIMTIGKIAIEEEDGKLLVQYWIENAVVENDDSTECFLHNINLALASRRWKRLVTVSASRGGQSDGRGGQYSTTWHKVDDGAHKIYYFSKQKCMRSSLKLDCWDGEPPPMEEKNPVGLLVASSSSVCENKNYPGWPPTSTVSNEIE